MSAAMDASTGETATCPWCSATVPVAATVCPACGASLRDAADGEVLGVTQVDPAAIARTKRIRSRALAAWLVGEGSAEEETGGKIEPPTDEVRQEMLRLELAAIDAEIESKRKAAEAVEAAEAGEAVEAVEAVAPAASDEAPSGNEAPSGDDSSSSNEASSG